MADNVTISANVVDGANLTGNVTDGYTVTTSVNEGTTVTANVVTGAPGADSTVPGPQGPQGDTGPAGANGNDGQDGLSAYEIAVNNGFVGTEAEWLDSLAASGGAVDSVNSQTGVVVLDTDDISDAGATNKYVTAAEKTKLSNLSGTNTGDQDLSGYATTSALTTGLAGKANTSHTHTASNITDFNTAVDARVQNVVGAAPAALDTLDELAAALGDDANFAATVTTSLAGKANTSHTHVKADVTDFAHTHPQSDITNLTTDLAGKQATLVSGTNIKTVNGSSLLGSGDLTISGGGGGGSGDVVGPASSTDTSIATFDGTTGKLIQSSGWKIDSLGGLESPSGGVYIDGTSDTISASLDVAPSSTLKTDVVSEYSGGSGVTIDGVLIKDGLVDGVDVSTLGSGSGDVVGPASSTGNVVAVFDGESGKLIKMGAIFSNPDTGVTTFDGDVENTGSFSTDGSFTALYSLKSNLVEERTAGAGITIDGVLVKDGLVDGRDVSTDGTKLDGIEAAADVTDATNVAAAGAIMDGDFSANGSMHRTAAGTYTARTITGTANLITVTNGDGVAGNPTITVGSNVYRSGGTDVSVADGGTGRSTNTTAYGIIAAGTTATNAMQTISPGTSGQFLKSAGASALASFATLSSADLSDVSSLATLTGTQTLSNKTLTSPFIGDTGARFNGSLGSTTVVANATASGTLTLPAATDTLVGKATTDTLTNKTISGSSNTLSNIPSTALVENFFRGRKQSDTTNSTVTGATVQFGWGYVTGDGTGGVNETVTFPTAFSSPPIVMMSYAGARLTSAGTPTDISDFNASSGDAKRSVVCSIITSSSFEASVFDVAGNTNSSINYAYTWIAIGQA